MRRSCFPPVGDLYPVGRGCCSLVWAALGVLINFKPNLGEGLLFMGYPLFAITIIVLQIYRYRRASTAIQRQQTKWAITGLLAVLIANQIFWLPTGFTLLGETLYMPVSFLFYHRIGLRTPYFSNGDESWWPRMAARVPSVAAFVPARQNKTHMEQQSSNIRKTYKYRLTPTPAQEQALETVLQRCRTLYNVALEQRKTWWERGQGKGATYYQQATELPDLKSRLSGVRRSQRPGLARRAAPTGYDISSVLPSHSGGEIPGYPRFQGRDRYHSFTYPQYGGGACWMGAVEPVQDGPHSPALASASGRHTQDGHHQPGSGWLVCLYLVCGRANTAAATNRPGNWDRRWLEGVPDHREW